MPRRLEHAELELWADPETRLPIRFDVRDDRGVVYFGDRVRAGESGRVLMRWRDTDGGYRVVFGDLRVDVVDRDELLELEER